MYWYDRAEKLKDNYTDKFVVVDPERPELQRFDGYVGRVKSVNMNGRALVEFENYHNNIGWFDIELDYLKVVEPEQVEQQKVKAKPKAPAKKESPAAEPSELELARAEKEGGQEEAGGMSVADMLAAARGEKSGAPAAKEKPAAEEKKPAEKPAEPKAEAKPAGKMSVADMLAAARGEVSGESAPAAEPEATPEAEPEAEAEPEPEAEVPAPEEEAAEEAPAKADAGDLPTDVAGMIAWCREHDGGD